MKRRLANRGIYASAMSNRADISPAMAKVLARLPVDGPIMDFGDDKLCMAGNESRFWLGGLSVRAATVRALRRRELLGDSDIEVVES